MNRAQGVNLTSARHESRPSVNSFGQAGLVRFKTVNLARFNKKSDSKPSLDYRAPGSKVRTITGHRASTHNNRAIGQSGARLPDSLTRTQKGLGIKGAKSEKGQGVTRLRGERAKSQEGYRCKGLRAKGA